MSEQQTSDIVIPIPQIAPEDMTLGQALAWIETQRRFVRKRQAEREQLQRSELPADIIATLTEVALTDASEMARLDTLEQSLLSSMDAANH